MGQDSIKLIAGDRVVTVLFGSACSTESMHFSVSDGFGNEWAFVQPGWRPLSFGTRNETVYLWSAREIIALPDDSRDRPARVPVDEDILQVYLAGDAWLVVCETSVRLLLDGQEISTIQLGEVVETSRLRGDQLTIRDVAGAVSAIGVTSGGLAIQ